MPSHSKIDRRVNSSSKTFSGVSEAIEKRNTNMMIDITNNIRAERHTKPPYDDVTGEINEILALLTDAEDSKRPISLSIISTSRLDKLLDELSDLRGDDLVEIEDLVRRANILRRKWQTRFGERYFAIDEGRLAQLSAQGALFRVALSYPPDRKEHREWLVRHPRPGSEKPGALHFQPGR